MPHNIRQGYRKPFKSAAVENRAVRIARIHKAETKQKSLANVIEGQIREYIRYRQIDVPTLARNLGMFAYEIDALLNRQGWTLVECLDVADALNTKISITI